MKKLLQTTGLIFAMLLLANVGMAQTFSPTNEATGVSTSPMLTITFDDNVELVKGKSIYVINSDLSEIYDFSTGKIMPPKNADNELVVLGNTLTIDLTGKVLNESTEFSVFADAGAIKVGGVDWDDLNDPTYTNSIWSFITEAPSVPISYFFTPENEASDVSTSPELIITFNANVELIKGKSIYVVNSDLTKIYDFSTGKIMPPISADDELVVIGTTLTIDLTGVVLSASTEFSVFADAGAIKVGGVEWDGLNDPTFTNSIWSFTTDAAPAGPTIDFFTPSDGSIDVSVNPTLTIDFDRPIAFGSGGSFRLKSNAGDVSFYTSNPNISISGNTLTINATGLTYSTLYQVEIDPGFIENYTGLFDPTYWTFTTETKPPQWAENYPTVTQNLSGFTLTGMTDLSGTYYFVVTNSMTPPTPTQIKAGQNSTGGAALRNFNSTMTGGIEFSTFMSFGEKLLTNQTYYLHVLATAGIGKNSEVITKPIDRTTPSINDLLSNPSNGYDLFQVEDSIHIVFSTEVFDFDGSYYTTLSEASFTLKIAGGLPVAFDFLVSADGTEVTLAPQVPLFENTEYEVIITVLSDEKFNLMNAVTRTFKTDKLNIWTGSSSSSWTDPVNWSDNSYVTRKSVLIPDNLTNYPVINSDITVNNFTIEAGAVVTQTGGIITVLGDFELLSSEVTNASYLPEGGSLDVQGETRVYQYIVPEHGIKYSYLMGSPTLGSTNTNIGTKYKVKYYDNPSDSWVSINSDFMEPGVGYLVYTVGDLAFTGDINRVSTTHDLVRTIGKGYGWNVMGNPFTAGMKWSELDINTATVENSYWIWNPLNKIYGAFNQEVGVGLGLDGTIPSNHGFLVKLKIGETTGSITFDPKAMVANNTNYLKSSSKSKPHMKISAGDGVFIDQLAIAFVSDAAQGVDKYDTEKYFGSGNTLEIFSVEGSSKLSINSLPETNEETTVGLGYRASKAGTYTIHLNENYLEHPEIILTDSKMNTMVDLIYQGSYIFTVDKQETNNSRFTLTFPAKVSTSIEKVVPINDMRIYLKDGDVIVDILSETKSLTYEMIGVSGNVVDNGNLHFGFNNLGKFPSGLYIVNTRNAEGVIISKKLLVTY